MLKLIAKKVRKATLEDKIGWVVGLISLCFLMWLFASFMEVQIHNWTMLDETPYQYSGWNFFTTMMEWFGK